MAQGTRKDETEGHHRSTHCCQPRRAPCLHERPQNPASPPNEMCLRRILTGLVEGRGDTPGWPIALLGLMEYGFECGRRDEIAYRSESLLRDRGTYGLIQSEQGKEGSPLGERSAVRNFFVRCRDESSSCLIIAGRRYWLLSFEMPSFAARRMQRADIVGINEEGGLVVFECKLAGNDYAPVTAVVEALDYLTCLTSSPNLRAVIADFHRLQSAYLPPAGFEGMGSHPDTCHEVIVLAELGYFERFRPTSQGEPRKPSKGAAGPTSLLPAGGIPVHGLGSISQSETSSGSLGSGSIFPKC